MPSFQKNILKEIGNTFSKAGWKWRDYVVACRAMGWMVPLKIYDFWWQQFVSVRKTCCSSLKHRGRSTKFTSQMLCHSGSMYASKTPYQMALTDFGTKFSKSTGIEAIITSLKKMKYRWIFRMRHGDSLSDTRLKKEMLIPMMTNIISVDELFNYIYLVNGHHTKMHKPQHLWWLRQGDAGGGWCGWDNINCLIFWFVSQTHEGIPLFSSMPDRQKQSKTRQNCFYDERRGAWIYGVFAGDVQHFICAFSWNTY